MRQKRKPTLKFSFTYRLPVFVLVGLMGSGLFGMTKKGWSMELKLGDAAPSFEAQTHENQKFDLKSRKDKWTVLYFYPKADTPGCTKQACAFRDSIEKIRALGAEVYGISSDKVDSLKKFHEKYQLSFTLLADPKLEIIKAYGVKMPILKLAKRWTFIVGPDLTIQSIDQDVDPVLDAQVVAEKLRNLQDKS